MVTDQSDNSAKVQSVLGSFLSFLVFLVFKRLSVPFSYGRRQLDRSGNRLPGCVPLDIKWSDKNEPVACLKVSRLSCWRKMVRTIHSNDRHFLTFIDIFSKDARLF